MRIDVLIPVNVCNVHFIFINHIKGETEGFLLNVLLAEYIEQREREGGVICTIVIQ